MIGAHARYAQGAVSSALGYESGEQTKKEAIEEMRDARDQQDVPSQNTLLGKVENAAGNLTGCEGMQNEGKSRQATGVSGGEEASRTG